MTLFLSQKNSGVLFKAAPYRLMLVLNKDALGRYLGPTLSKLVRSSKFKFNVSTKMCYQLRAGRKHHLHRLHQSRFSNGCNTISQDNWLEQLPLIIVSIFNKLSLFNLCLYIVKSSIQLVVDSINSLLEVLLVLC